MKKLKNKMLLIIISSIGACHTVQTANYNEPNGGLILIGAAAGAICFRCCYYACKYGLKKCCYGIKECLDSCDKYDLKELSDLLEQQQRKDIEDARAIPEVNDLEQQQKYIDDERAIPAADDYEKTPHARPIVPPLNLEQLTKKTKNNKQVARVQPLPLEDMSESYHESDNK